jgi:hypothetical protein
MTNGSVEVITRSSGGGAKSGIVGGTCIAGGSWVSNRRLALLVWSVLGRSRSSLQRRHG